MQEDESNVQPEPEEQHPSERETEGSQPEPEQQPTSESAADESQPEPEPQPPSKQGDESQPEQEEQPPSERERGWSEYEWNRYKGETEGSEYKPQQPPSGKERVESQPGPQQQSPSGRGADQSRPRQRLQRPPAPPIPLPPTTEQKRRQYFLGLGWGSIPLIIFLVSGISLATPGENSLSLSLYLFFLGVISYIVELIVMIVYLANQRQRFVGYGLLTAFLATPVVAVIACSVIPIRLP